MGKTISKTRTHMRNQYHFLKCRRVHIYIQYSTKEFFFDSLHQRCITTIFFLIFISFYSLSKMLFVVNRYDILYQDIFCGDLFWMAQKTLCESLLWPTKTVSYQKCFCLYFLKIIFFLGCRSNQTKFSLAISSLIRHLLYSAVYETTWISPYFGFLPNSYMVWCVAFNI